MSEHYPYLITSLATARSKVSGYRTTKPQHP